MTSPLERALAAAARRSWADACAAFAEAQAGGPLSGDDLERYAVAASMPLAHDAAYDVVVCQMGLMFMPTRTAPWPRCGACWRPAAGSWW